MALNPDARLAEHRNAIFVCFVFVFPESREKFCYIYVEGNIHKQERCVMLYYRHYHFIFFPPSNFPMHIIIVRPPPPLIQIDFLAILIGESLTVRPLWTVSADKGNRFRLFVVF